MRHSNTDDRTSRLNLLSGLKSIAMSGCLLGFALFLWPAGDNPSRGKSIASSEMRLASSRSNASTAPVEGDAPSRWTQPIEAIEVGQRVLANNPEVSDSERASWKTPAWSQWLHLSLVMPKPDGQELHIELLRDEGWVLDSMFAIVEANSDPPGKTDKYSAADLETSDAGVKPIGWRQQTVAHSPVRPVFRQIWQLAAEAQVGGTEFVGLAVEMDLPELGITGPAYVTDVQSRPRVAEGDGQVVTATFHHTSGDILDLTVGDDTGATETLGTTSNHPFWSEDRQDYVQAGTLEIGERLLTYHGDTKRVITKLARPGPEPVYNLEVFGEHVYYVGQLGTLVHNSQNYNAPKSLAPGDVAFSQRTVGRNVSQYEDDMANNRWDWSRSGPINVMKQGDRYVTFDNRRLMAARKGGLSDIPVNVVDPKAIRPGTKKTWEKSFRRRFTDRRNKKAGGVVPYGGLMELPVIAPKKN